MVGTRQLGWTVRLSDEFVVLPVRFWDFPNKAWGLVLAAWYLLEQLRANVLL